MSAPMLNKLDELLNQLRTGWWSVLHYITMGFCMALPVSHALSGPFVAPRVEFTCLQPPNEVSGPFINDDLESGNGTELSQRYFNNSERYCSQYNQIMDGGIYEEGNCTELHFDKSVFTKTITSEFELICDRNYLRATYQSIYMGGVFFGCLLSAILADKYGRKGVIIFGVITFTALGLASSWTRNLSALLFCRFLMGVIMPFMSNNCYIMVVEISEAHLRPYLGILAAMPWACSVMIWGGLAYLIRDWRWLLFTTSITGVFIIPVLWFIDESPRWLAVKGHHERALKVLKKAARWNRATLPPDDTALQILKESRDDGIPTRDKLRHKGLKEVIIEKMKETAILFRTPKLRRITCILYVDYLIVNFVYYGLSLNGGNLSDDPFLFMALSGLMEVPAYSLPVPIVSRFGRRVPGSVSFLLSGVTLLAVSPLPKRYGWLIMTLAMIGKVTISTAFQVLIFYSSELFPTEVRSRGIGTCFMVSRIGSIVSPFITEILGSSFPWAPSLLFGACSVIASIALLTLPETSGIALPDTITQLEQRQDKVRSWKFFRSAERKVNESEDRKESTDPL